MREGLGILAVGAVVSFIPALLLGDPLAAVQFACAFTLLFVFPLTPWVLLLERPWFERFVLATVLGVAGLPITFFIIGVLKGPLTLLVFLAVPFVVFSVGAVLLRRKMKRVTKSEHAHPASASAPPAQPPAP
ncbi:MAG TPA: hypothetical protein VLJ21_04385 [Candidatus Binatia bacterium]|nr:hypothetical protein [Candidatus Binatia bacterium]